MAAGWAVVLTTSTPLAVDIIAAATAGTPPAALSPPAAQSPPWAAAAAASCRCSASICAVCELICDSYRLVAPRSSTTAAAGLRSNSWILWSIEAMPPECFSKMNCSCLVRCCSICAWCSRSKAAFCDSARCWCSDSRDRRSSSRSWWARCSRDLRCWSKRSSCEASATNGSNSWRRRFSSSTSLPRSSSACEVHASPCVMPAAEASSSWTRSCRASSCSASGVDAKTAATAVAAARCVAESPAGPSRKVCMKPKGSSGLSRMTFWNMSCRT
mmetsp:Transcript_130177/g.417769  ORF Transcript_130177/g.417769 Transcript_130177/m.417769 type:complete len:272 (+) Transcript_130177:1145-1960(+)